MTLYQTNCILTPHRGPQVFLDLEIPLEAGEDACRALFVAAYAAFLKGQGESFGSSLAKVSMCAEIPTRGDRRKSFESNPNLAWFNEGNGKLYFEE